MPALAMVAAVVLTLTTVGVLVLARSANQPTKGAIASGPRVSISPTPTPAIYLPTTVTLSPTSSNVVWALVDYQELFLSTNAGSTWQARSLPAGAASGGRGQISFVDDRVGWMLIPGSPETQCNGDAAELWRTTDGAATWQQMTAVDYQSSRPGGLGYAQCKDGLAFVDAEHGVVTAWDDNHRPTIWRTSDGGATWTASTLQDPPGFVTQGGGFALHVGTIRSFGRTMVLTASGRQDGDALDRFYFFQSVDGGARWSYLARLPDTASRAVGVATVSRWLAVSPGGPSLETSDKGRTWHGFTSDYNQAAGVAPQIVFGDSLTGYATVRGEIQRTADGGAHWTTL
ncbi:MAG TPA: hypothetical protein VGG31_07535, partial [Candidatus Dormibacteraeota bacterium]